MEGDTALKKAAFMVVVAACATALMAQDASKFNGTWKGDGGQVRKLNFKDGIVFMEETQTNGRVILRQYPVQGQEITMTEGVWKDSKATGKLEGSKLVVDTTMPTGMKWHDEWTMAEDGKSYSALRQMVSAGTAAALAAGKVPKRARAKVVAGARKRLPKSSRARVDEFQPRPRCCYTFAHEIYCLNACCTRAFDSAVHLCARPLFRGCAA